MKFGNSKIITLWDEEIKKKEREIRKEVTGKPYEGRYTPFNVKVNPVELLLKAGYRKIERGYVRKVDKEYRFHAFVFPHGKIELHTDKTKQNKKGKYFHLSSTHNCKSEKKRIKKYLPEEPHPQAKKKKEIRMFRDEFLPFNLYKEVIKDVTDSNKLSTL